MPSILRQWRPLLAGLLSLGLAGVVLALTLRLASAQLLERDAARSALSWAQIVEGTVHDLESLFAGDGASAQARADLARLRNVQEVFRFKFFDPRGELIATAAGDGQTRLWDLRSGRLLGTENGRGIRLGLEGRVGMEDTLNHRLTVHRIGPSPVYQRWRGTALQVEDMQAMDISPDGDCAATGVAGTGLRLWNLRLPGASPDWYDYPGVDSV